MRVSIQTESGRTWQAEPQQVEPPVQPVPPLWRVLTDHELGRFDRNRLPMVFWFKEETVEITKEWQFYLCAINPGMSLQHVAALLDYKKFACNNMGLGNPLDPRRNYITRENLDAPKNPFFSKVYTCGDARVNYQGTYILTLDGRAAPVLKPGKTQPRAAAEATLDRYVYTPQSHPERFYAAVNSVDGRPRPFPNGALYPWYKGGTTPVTFMPHVSKSVVAWPPSYRRVNTATLVKL